MSTLEGTPFAIAYLIFGVADDSQLLNRICLVYGIGIILTSVLKPPKYGKLTSAEDKAGEKGSLISISARTGWMVGILPSLFIPIVLILTTPRVQMWNFCNLSGLALFITHYFNRAIIYPMTISKDAKPIQLTSFTSIAIGVSFNSFLQAHSLVNVLPTVITPISYLGLILGVSGLLINKYHDYLLTSLRGNKSGSKTSTTTGYKIPRGGLFEYVSCANFFGELVEWWGFALLCGGLPQLLMALGTTVFLGHRAFCTHAYYLKTFGKQYPSNRQALIPYLF